MKNYIIDNCSEWKNTKQILVLHHTATPPWSLKWVISTFKDINKDVSRHYIVSDTWEVVSFNNEDSILWHAWVSSWRWLYNLNPYSIWVEVIWPWFNDKQRVATDDLLIDIIKRNNISKENVVRHKDITQYNWNSLLWINRISWSLSRKVDIDDSFWNTRYSSWEEYKNYLFSKLTIMETIWFYEEFFKNKNYSTNNLVIKDVDWLLEKCINKDWTLNAREFTFAMLIWLQRLNERIILV